MGGFLPKPKIFSCDTKDDHVSHASACLPAFPTETNSRTSMLTFIVFSFAPACSLRFVSANQACPQAGLHRYRSAGDRQLLFQFLYAPRKNGILGAGNVLFSVDNRPLSDIRCPDEGWRSKQVGLFVFTPKASSNVWAWFVGLFEVLIRTGEYVECQKALKTTA